VAGGTFSRVVSGSLEALISFEGVVDVAAERMRLDRAITELVAAQARTEAKLANPQFVERAPAEVVTKERERSAELSATLAKLTTQRSDLE